MARALGNGLGWILAALWIWLCAAAGGQPARPNIVWLVAEDMSPWIACYGDGTVATPNLDRLAGESVRFANAFASSPVCAPARSAIITGMYPTRIGSMHMRNGQRSSAGLERDPSAYDGVPLYEAVPPAFVRCFPEVLRAAGYYCTNNSKKDYQFVEPPTVWDASSGRAHWRDRPEGVPFFSVFNCGLTHESRAFPDAKKQPGLVGPHEVTVPPFYPDTPAVRDALARTYNNIAAMDAWVGARIAELEEAGVLEDTIVFFYSDHGVGLPRGKRDLYDTGVRVPLLVRFPGGERGGEVADQVVSFVDFGPTVLSLAGIEPDDRVDGRAFLGEFAGEPRRFAFLHADRMDAVYDTQRGVTDGRYKYIRNFTPDRPLLGPVAYRERLEMTADLYELRERGNDRPEQWQLVAWARPIEELYDTREDPWEVRNLASDPGQLERLGEMRAALKGWIAETGDLGFLLPESRLVSERLWPPDGVQPVTAAPEVLEVEGGIVLRCATEGASVGYRSAGGDVWSVYSAGAVLDPGLPIEVVAHRIGYKRSGVTSWPRPGIDEGRDD